MEEEVRNSQTLSRISSITCVIIFKLSLNCKKGNDFRLDDFQLLFQNGSIQDPVLRFYEATFGFQSEITAILQCENVVIFNPFLRFYLMKVGANLNLSTQHKLRNHASFKKQIIPFERLINYPPCWIWKVFD